VLFRSNYSKGGRIKATKKTNKYDFYIVENSTKKLVSGYSTKAEAVEQRRLLIEQYPAMRFEIYPLAKLETKTQLDVNAKKDYVELSTLDKIKKVSVDAYRYGQDKVGQANAFLERNDVKGKIKRGARKVADKTKQGANFLRSKWLEADFGDGTGRAKFFADGGGVEKVLFAVKKGEPDWAEELITEKESKFEEAKKWADLVGAGNNKVFDVSFLQTIPAGVFIVTLDQKRTGISDVNLKTIDPTLTNNVILEMSKIYKNVKLLGMESGGENDAFKTLKINYEMK
jgi:hypothetical protein